MFETIFQSAIGQAGLIFLIAEFLDVVLKTMGKRGVWEDLGNFLKKAGEGIGSMIVGFIPGNKVEPVLADFLSKLDDASDEFLDSLIEELESKKNGGE